MRTIAIIPAAGAGMRMGGETPKPYLFLGGESILALSVARLAAATRIDGIVLVVAPGRITEVEQTVMAQHPKVRCVVAGGETRQTSVRCGLEAISSRCDFVAVHDAARPLIAPATIDRCVERAMQEGAAIVAVPAADTVKVVHADHHILETVPRETIWLAQTPQVIAYELLCRAMAHADAQGLVGTDEAALVEAFGVRVAVVHGSRWNLKITTPEDLRLAEVLLERGGDG
ncbi:MAG: 2-C-methyl-D-erythritol 4-phosphate cytidylyltransferase [Deltaproteobacteria bacterium]|nr:2-C-methyl-D-erythritol 4-phosphate cytidylyltransferase [Deltaproteobacteria bacterium]